MDSTVKNSSNNKNHSSETISQDDNNNVESLALNLEYSLNLVSKPNNDNSSPVSSSSTFSSSQNVLVDNENKDNNNVNDPTISSSNNNENSGKSSNYIANTNVPKFGTPVPDRVFVGGIPDDATEHDVQQLFAQYGNIISVKIITDRAGISKGYGFVTFEREEDAQKVIKETDDLVIKNRKLNVSTAVMKHQHLPESKTLHGGSFLYPQIPFASNISAANIYNQFYENFPGFCPAEGLPLYQIAGMNGHYINNPCTSLLASPAQTAAYMVQTTTHSQYSASYHQNQATANFIYPNVAPGNSSSVQMTNSPSQNALFSSNQHLMSPAAHQQAFQYSNSVSNSAAIGPTTGNNTTESRYPLVPNPNSTQSSQMNLTVHQQYHMQFSNPISASMNLPCSTHLSDVNPGPNSSHQNVQLNSNGGGGGSLPPGTLVHSNPVPNNQSTIYSTYPSSNLGSTQQLPLTSHNANPLHLPKNDSSNIELYDSSNVGPSASNLAHLSATAVHLTNNSGYGLAPPVAASGPSHLMMNDTSSLMWSTSHGSVPNNAASIFGANTTNNLSLNGNTSSYNKSNNVSRSTLHSNHTSYSNHSKSSPPNSSSSHHSLKNTAYYPSNNSSNHGNNHQSTREKPHSRYNSYNSSYNNSSHHKKMYNGTNLHNKGSKVLNGSFHGGNGIYYNSSMADFMEQNRTHSHHISKLNPPNSGPTSNHRPSNHHLAPVIHNHHSATLSQNLVTKTVNGVQIYALANNINDSPSPHMMSSVVGQETILNSLPPLASNRKTGSTISYKS